MVEPHTAGDPIGPAKWLNCRLQDLRKRLLELGHGVSYPVISRLLKGAGYRLRLDSKRYEGQAHPERDTQFT